MARDKIWIFLASMELPVLNRNWSHLTFWNAIRATEKWNESFDECRNHLMFTVYVVHTQNTQWHSLNAWSNPLHIYMWALAVHNKTETAFDVWSVRERQANDAIFHFGFSVKLQSMYIRVIIERIITQRHRASLHGFWWMCERFTHTRYVCSYRKKENLSERTSERERTWKCKWMNERKKSQKNEW